MLSKSITVNFFLIGDYGGMRIKMKGVMIALG